MPVKAQNLYGENPLVNTYSIVAIDKETGEMGVAVQSHWFSVGTIVSWGEAGVGVIATQSFANPQFGPDGLELLREGKDAKTVGEALIAGDDGRDVRQLAVLDAKGNAWAYTGKSCLDAAGDLTGDGYAVQANMMASDKVWPAMEKAFLDSKGALEDRMMAALEAAEAEGGDVRGKQSAAMLVVNAESTGKVWADRKVDIQIADHPEPLKELKRIIRINKAYAYMNQGDVAMEHEDMDKALELYQSAENLYSENPEMTYWTAVTLFNNDQKEKAMEKFKLVFESGDHWKILTERIHPQLLTASDEELQEILSIK